MGKRGGAGTVYADKPAQEKADGTVVKSHQRMPTQLLQEWAQREKRPKPWYSSVRPWERGKFRQKVYLEDPKKKEASLEFTAASDSDSLFEAKEHAAMVALLKVQGQMPLERKFPDPYAELWKASVAAAAAASKCEAKARKPDRSATAAATHEAVLGDEVDETGGKSVAPLRAASHYASKAEKAAVDEERRRERNKRDAERENRRRANANPPILLSKRMRTCLYDALGLSASYDSAAAEDDMEMDEAESLALGRCMDWGFTPDDATRALRASREDAAANRKDENALAEYLRKWLCLHVPEDELPEEFSASRGQFDVRRPGKAQASAQRQAKSAFELAMEELLAWLQQELSSRLGQSDAESLFLSTELVLRGCDLDVEEEAAEAGENAAAVLQAGGEEAESLCPELSQRWQAALDLRKASPSAGASAEPVAAEKSPKREDPEVESEDDASTRASTADAADGFWEETCGVRSASGKSSTSWARARTTSRRCWFGTKGPASGNATSSGAAAQRMQKLRDGLPAAKSREELLSLVKTSQVVLVQGETGCGKTTQVGQFLIEASGDARVVVTQPRRVAAVSVAQRVADERGERLGQGAVGYSVRGETQLHRESCRLLFCTNGILLRRLLGEPEDMFSDRTCTHLIIDEVHERSVEIDLLLTLLSHRLSDRPGLRVLLMSATMDVEQLSQMFLARPPVVKIPGRTFPVTQLYLEDAEDQIGMYTKFAADASGVAEDVEATGSGRRGAGGQQRYLSPLDFGMLAKLVRIAARGEFKDGPKDGAILVFVPGVGEISRLISELQRSEGPPLSCLPLHGALPSEQQRRCFEVPPRGAPRKVVVSTNVAETSVTVPDVTVVIDTARERRLVLDPGAVAPCLSERLCAQSSLRQRKGRAGRVQAGLCLTLLPRRDYAALPKESPPEIEAAALETLCLQVRVAGFDPVKFLARAPTPPLPERVAAAERMLLKIGATRLTAGGAEVCALGRHLAALPCDVHTGKLLVLGAFLGVASAAADAAAMLSVRSPLKSTQHDQQADNFRVGLRNTLRPGGGKSDHCLQVALMQLWHEDRSNRGRRELCQKAALAYERMAEAATVRAQLVAGLRGLGFALGGEDDRNGSEWRVLRAAVCAAFYPQVARVDRPPKEYTEGIAGAIEKQAEARRMRYFVLTDVASDSFAEDPDSGRRFQKHEDSMRAFLHPSSVLFKEANYSCPYVVFSSKQAQEARADLGKPARLNLSEASEASVFALLLFGGSLRAVTQRNEVLVDEWIAFSSGSTTVVALVEKLRTEIDALLLRKVESPQLSLASEAVAQAVATLIKTDGLGS